MKEYIKTENKRDRLIQLAITDVMDKSRLEEILDPDFIAKQTNESLTAQQRAAFSQYAIGRITVEDVVDVYNIEEVGQAITKLSDARLTSQLSQTIIDPNAALKDKAQARQILEQIQEKNAIRKNSHIHVLYMPPNDVTKYDMELYGVWEDFQAHSKAIIELQQKVWDEKTKGSK